MYVYGICLFYVCCSDCVGVCWNVCWVAAVVKDSFFSLGVVEVSCWTLFSSLFGPLGISEII